MDEEVENKLEEFEETLETRKAGGKYILRLFVAGINPRSIKAIENLRELIEENLEEGNYELEIIDIYQRPIFAKEGKIVAPPIRRFVGDLSDKEKLLIGLDLRSRKG